MIYNPDIDHRYSIRLKDYDYNQNGVYFITACTENRQNLFGKIIDGNMMLNRYGEVTADCILKIEKLYANVKIPCKTVMPNHVHFIIQIVGVAYHATQGMAEGTIQQKSKMILPKIIQQFKTATIKLCKSDGTGLHTMQPLRWQRNYYEHIIRNEQEYQKIWEYIETNPIKWQEDCHCDIGRN